ncbi:hypothetical protein [Streptomyces sp. NPDC048650]|uniref:hypothetical protein n=1 Tax=unclassified Streptomyces TaxID=2593676 RepID=UPI0037123999
MLRRVSTVLTGALVAGVIATGAAAAAPAPDQGQPRMHQGQAQHMRSDGDRRHNRLDNRFDKRRDNGRQSNRRHRYEDRDGLFVVGRVLHALLGGGILGGRGY